MQASKTFDTQLAIPPRVRSGVARRRLLALLAAFLLALGIAVWLVARPLESEQATYRTALIERRTITQVVEAAGHLDVVIRADVPAPLSGQIVEIFVRTGDAVKRGQALARLDQRATSLARQDAYAGVRAATSRVAEAEATLSSASDARGRAERLRERRLASDSELSVALANERKAQAALQVARAERSSADQRYRASELAQASTHVSSPLDGVVLKVPETVGSAVAPDQGPLFVIGSAPEQLRILADVAESDIGLVRLGQLARFSVPAFPGRTFEARVAHTELDAVRSGLAVRYLVTLSVENPERLLLPGMTTTVKIEVARAENVLATREAALRFRPQGVEDDAGSSRSRVWRISGAGLAPIAVKPSLSDGAFTAIESEPAGALVPGNEVVIGLADSRLAEQPRSPGPGIRLGKR